MPPPLDSFKCHMDFIPKYSWITCVVFQSISNHDLSSLILCLRTSVHSHNVVILTQTASPPLSWFYNSTTFPSYYPYSSQPEQTCIRRPTFLFPSCQFSWTKVLTHEGIDRDSRAVLCPSHKNVPGWTPQWLGRIRRRHQVCWWCVLPHARGSPERPNWHCAQTR